MAIDRRSMTLKDSKGKVLRQPRDNSGADTNFKWWTAKEGSDMAKAIQGTLRFIQNKQNARVEQLVMSTRLIGSSSAYNLMGGVFTRSSLGAAAPSQQRLSYNVCSSVGDTLTSKMAKNKVIPTFVTNGGIWAEQKKAKSLTKFAQGWFYEINAHDRLIEMFNDAYTWGDGFLYVYNDGKRARVERTLPHELWVDHIESMVTDPTQMFRVKLIDRDVALDMFPEMEEAIMKCAPANYQEIGGQGTAADLIEVIEAWHLKSGDKAKDGIRAVTIGDGCAPDDYKKDRFPFVHYRYAKRKVGWYGMGGVERLQNLQGEINRGMILKQRSLHMMASFKILLEKGSKVVTQHLNNEVATIIHYTGTPPQYVTPPATNPELQQWIDSLIMKAYQQEGVSQLSTTGEAPMGVESGKAMRTLTQISDDRFLYQAQQLEDAALDLAALGIDTIKDIYGDKKSYEVVFPTNNFIETVDWKDIQLDEEQYVLKAYPTSSLSDDITGRLSEIQELMQAGLVSPRTGRRLMDMPDIEMNDNLSNAAEDYIHKCLENMLYDGEQCVPEQFNDLQLAKELALQYYNYAQYMSCPEDKLSLVRTFLSLVDDAMMTAQPPPQPGAMPGAPMAGPQATPTSNLIQNTPNPTQGVM